MKPPPIDIPGDGNLLARVVTSAGQLVIRLYERRAPLTVANFVGLATGAIEWIDPRSGEAMKGVPFYDGLRIHRVVRNFVMQLGDPWTRYDDERARWGTGDPGYSIADEFHPDLKHNRAGVVSMANKGDPDTGGCQFFITEVPAPHLDNRHAVFGQVTFGQDTARRIREGATGDKDRPLEKILVEQIAIFRH